MGKHGPRPAVLGVSGGVPLAQLEVVELAQQLDDVAPGQLSNAALDNVLLIGPCLSEGAHVEQVCPRKALHGGEGGSEIGGQPLQYLRTPVMLRLAVSDGPTDPPLQSEQLSICGALGAVPGVLDALLQFREG